MNGIIVIDKPRGMTSHDVVSVLRRKTGEKRIGHSGTLDPMATGVLPVFIGKATRVIEYAKDAGDTEAKLYYCDMRLGIETDTQDIWGTVVSQNEKIPEFSTIESVLKSFEGPGTQKPPMYSAVKVGGRKLYEYARKGETVEEGLIREREIYIKQIDVKHVDPDKREASFEVLCSGGVYIRTLCADAGKILGCGAVMSGLKRLKSDGFTIDMAVSLDTATDSVDLPLLPIDAPLGRLPRVEADKEAAVAFSHGRPIADNTGDHTEVSTGDNTEVSTGVSTGDNTEVNTAVTTGGETVRVYSAGSFIGIGKRTGDSKIHPEKVLV